MNILFFLKSSRVDATHKDTTPSRGSISTCTCIMQVSGEMPETFKPQPCMRFGKVCAAVWIFQECSTVVTVIITSSVYDVRLINLGVVHMAITNSWDIFVFLLYVTLALFSPFHYQEKTLSSLHLRNAGCYTRICIKIQFLWWFKTTLIIKTTMIDSRIDCWVRVGEFRPLIWLCTFLL